MKNSNFMGKLVLLFYLLIIFSPVIALLYEEFGEGLVSFVINDYARITDVEYEAVVIDDEKYGGGKILVTERLTYDIHAASKNNLFWELWRDLPEDTVDGLHVDYDVLSVKQIMDDGSEIIYDKSNKLYWDDEDYISESYGPGKWFHSEGPYDDYYNFECVLFYVDGLYREEVTFEIQYIMNNASFRYLDVSQLYLNLFSDDDIKHLNSYKGQILIPNKDMPSKGNYLATTYGTKNYKFDFSESDTLNPGYHTFSIDLDEKDLKFTYDTRYIEFSLLAFNEDRHIFTEYAPDNFYSNDVYYEEVLDEIDEYYNIPIQKRNDQIKLLVYSLIASAIAIVYTVKRDSNIRKKHTFYNPSLNIEYFRDIPSDLDPHFAAYLVFSKHNRKNSDDLSDSLSALMMSLARKKYIEINKNDPNGDWSIKNINIKILYSEPIIPTLKVNSEIVKKNIDNIESSNKKVVDYLIGNNTSKPITINSTNDNVYGVRTISQNNGISNINQPNSSSYQARTITQNTNVTNSVINNDKFNIKGEKLEKLSKNEEQYFNLITKYTKFRNNEISLAEFQDKIYFYKDYTDSFITSVENSILRIGMNDKYFSSSNYDSVQKEVLSNSRLLSILGWILLIVGNYIVFYTGVGFNLGGCFIAGIVLVICGRYLKKIHKNYLLLTQFGEDEYAKWRGLYNFLNSETLMNERTVIDLVLWEKYLVYATAFGISEKVNNALKIRCPEATLADSSILSNGYYRSNYYRTHSRSFARTARSASYSSRSSKYHGGYYGGGGSYGGGGRGGGGGGGGH